jgi:hypothetical protein
MMPQSIHALKQAFQKVPSFTKKELYDFLVEANQTLSEAELLWCIYELKNKNIIQKIATGVYQWVIPKKNFEPILTPLLKAIIPVLKQDYPFLNYCIWATEWLDEWTIHQWTHHFTMLEVEAAACESVFYQLRDKGFKDVFLKPDTLLMNRYVSETQNALVVTPLTTRAPLTTIPTEDYTLRVPKIEKILVDLFCEDTLFAAYKGNELLQIYHHVLKNYQIDFRSLFAYADRRRRKSALVHYLYQHFKTILIEIAE